MSRNRNSGRFLSSAAQRGFARGRVAPVAVRQPQAVHAAARVVRKRARGLVAIQVAVTLTVLIGAAALTVDVAHIYTARGELQRAADSAALAGTSAYLTDAGLLYASNQAAWSPTGPLATMIDERAQSYSLMNHTLGAVTHLPGDDIVKGFYDFAHPELPLSFTSSLTQHYNAVQVTTRRQPNTPNGPVPYFFAFIFGTTQGSVTARATAAMDDHFTGYDVSDGPGVVVPFSICQQEYDTQFASGLDQWRYIPESDSVLPGSDGVHEVRLYPYGQGNLTSACGSNAGNFGTLNIGIPNQGTTGLYDQILNGVSSADLISEVGTDNLVFNNAQGAPITYEMSGNPGLSSGLSPAVEARIGDVVGFFLHSGATLQGSNVIYTIVGMRFGRVMHIDLTGSPNNKRLVIQPVPFTGPGVETNPSAPSTNGQVGVFSLVR
ncbi:MAG TPA: TadG family pilus assembly protein [Phycisphaerae bacterium]|jgi:hypothetical protein